MASWTQSTMTGDGVSLAYYRTDGRQPTIVCAHGITDAAGCMMRLGDALAAEGFGVVRYDARGHGQSSTPPSDYRAQTLADDLLALIDALELKRPIVLGHSMGAHTAALAAAHRPERIGGLILEDPPWMLTERLIAPEDLNNWRAWIAQAKTMGDDEMITSDGGHVYTWHESERAPWVAAKRQAQDAIFNWFNESLDWRTALPSITCPTLLITGDPAQGAIVNEECAALAMSLCATLQVGAIEGAGHSIRRDRFEGYMEQVKTFLRTQTTHE